MKRKVWVITVYKTSDAGFAIVGIFADKFNAQIKIAQLKENLTTSNSKDVQYGLEEYMVE
jgi:hypothetical protein